MEGGSVPLDKVHRASLRLDKFILDLPKEEGKVRLHQSKNSATRLYLLTPFIKSFTYNGLASIL